VQTIPNIEAEHKQIVNNHLREISIFTQDLKMCDTNITSFQQYLSNDQARKTYYRLLLQKTLKDIAMCDSRIT